MGTAKRAAAGAYRETRLVTPTLSLYGTVLYAAIGTPPATPEFSTGMSGTPTTSPSRTSPASGYYLAEEQPAAVVRRVLDFLAAN